MICRVLDQLICSDSYSILLSADRPQNGSAFFSGRRAYLPITRPLLARTLQMEGREPSSSTPALRDEHDDGSNQPAASLDESLEPRANPTGVFLQFVWNQEVVLRIFQRRFSWTYRDFVVTDTNGVEVFQLVGRVPSTHMKTSMMFLVRW